MAELTLKSLPHPFLYPDGDSGAAEAAGHVIDGDEYGLLPIRKAGHWVGYVVDAGGNCGAFGVQAARIFPGCSILAAEPIAYLRDYYKENYANQLGIQPRDDGRYGMLPGLELHTEAWVNDDAGSASLYHYYNGSTGSFLPDSWHPDYEKDFNCKLNVVTARLSESLLDCYWPRVDVLKLDCEGSEADILTDLAENYGLWRIRWIRFEWHGLENLNRIIEIFRKSATHVPNWDCRPGQKLGFGLAHNRLDA